MKKDDSIPSVESVVPQLKVRKFARLETKVRGGDWTLDDEEWVDGYVYRYVTSRNFGERCYAR